MIDINSFGQFLDEEDGQQARASAITAPAVSPDDMAKAMQIGQKRNLPAAVVAANLPDYHEQEHLDGVTAASAQSPAAARWFQTPEHAALAKGEPDKIGTLADVLSRTGDFIGDTIQNLLPFQFDQRQRLNRLGLHLRSGEAQPVGGALQEVGDFLGAPYEYLRSQLQFAQGPGMASLFAATDAPVTSSRAIAAKGADIADFGRAQSAQASQGVSRPASVLDALQRPGNAFDYYGGIAAESLPMMLASAPFRTIGPAVGGIATQGQSYGQYRSEGVDAGAALHAANLQGLFEGLGEILPFHEAFRPGGSFLARLARTQAAETGSEMATQVAQDESESQALNRTITWQDRVANVIDAGISAFGMALPVSIAGHASPEAVQARHNLADLGGLADSVNSARRVGAIVDTVQGMKLGQRSPDALHALAKEAAPDANVYLSGEAARTLFQSDRASADQFVGDLTGNPEALREAEATGGDIVIPMADFVSKVATLPNAADIAQHARLHPEHLSRAELNNGDALNEHLAAIFGDTEAAPEAQADSSEQVTQDVLGMLLASDRYTPADAELQAKLVGRVFGQIAQRSGQDALDLYNRYQLRINGRGAHPGKPNTLDPRTDALLTAARTDTLPSARDAYGPTLVDLAQALGVNEDALTGEARRIADSDQARKQAMRQHGRIRDYQQIVRDDGVPLDTLREAAVEAGYLPEGADINDLLDALDRELVTDQPVHSEANRNHKIASFRDDALGFQSAIAEKFGEQPTDHLSNQDIHDALFPPERSLLQRAGDKVRSLFQGKPVDQTDTTAFRKWFGDSKVVDAQGRPLVVYHGTGADFDTFSADHIGQNFDDPDGYFFTNNVGHHVARFGTPEKLETRVYEDMTSAGAYAKNAAGKSGGAANVMPVYVSLQNPLVIEQDSDEAGVLSLIESRTRSAGHAVEAAKEAGYDGIIVRDTGMILKGEPETVVIAFRPEQIKSATANNGNFDASKPSILHQAAKPVAPSPSPGVEFAHAEAALQSRLAQWPPALRLGASGPRAVAANAEGIGAVARNADGAAQQGDASPADLREQSGRLIDRAKAEGFFWPDDHPIIAALDALPADRKGAGAEHVVYIVGEGESRFVIRATDNGYFGPRSDISPAQYLQRLDDYSATFPDLQMRLIGVSESPDVEGHAVVWSMQPYVRGKKFATQALLAEAMATHGWKEDGYPGSPRFVHAENGAIIEDAHTDNVFHDDGGNIYPFDVVVEKLPERTLNQPAFHGSPHRFEKFSLQHIGKGEGAQAYGWGMYFASSKDIAEHYRDSLSRVSQSGQSRAEYYVDGEKADLPEWTSAKSAYYAAAHGRLDDYIKTWEAWPAEHPGNEHAAALAERNLSKARGLVGKEVREEIPKGQLYQVDVPEDHDLLDWDKPLSEQSEKVQAGIAKIIADGALDKDALREWNAASPEQQTGKRFYTLLSQSDHVAARDGAQGASETLNAAGIPGLRYLDSNSRNKGDGSHNYVIWDEGAIGDPTTFYQPDGAGAPRGQLRIGANRSMSIDLLKGADLSTFLHESGHFFLEVMTDAAEQSADVKADLDAIRAWTGNTGEAFTEDQHEQFARGFEAYLREGKSPAPDLLGMFGRFRAWLTGLYRDLRSLNVTLTDDVRGVFDRMIATDSEIEAAQVRQGMQPLTLAPESRALLSDTQWNAYVASLADATEEARTEVLQALLKAHKREAMAWWKEQQAKTRDEVEAEFEAAPVVRAWRVLSGRQTVGGEAVPEHLRGLRLDRAALVAMTSEQWVKDNLLKLGVYRKEGGVHPDTAAMALGFDSGDALIKALSTVRDLQARITAEVDARMHERHPDPLTDGSLPERAMDAVHNVKRVAALEAELAIIAKLANEPAPPARLVREYARRKIAGLTLRSIRPNDYLAAERKASRETAKAAAQGDYAEALQHKRAQALNVALYAEARAAQDRAEAQIAALKKLASDKARERIGKAGKAYLDALDAVLEGHELRVASGAEVRRRDALRAWAESQQDDMGVTILAPELLDRIEAERVTNVRDLTIQQLTDLHETATNIAHLARLKNTLLKGKDQREWSEAKDELLAHMRAVLDAGKPPPLSSADLSLLERAGQAGEQFMDWMLRPETVVEWLDGGESGPWHDYFWAPMEAGEQRRNALRAQVAEPLTRLLTDLPKADRAALDDVVSVPEIGRSVSRNTILSLLLNLGTASSRDKLLRGGMMVDGEVLPFHPEQVAAMLRHLTPAQANLAQQVWDALDTLWPEIQAQQEAQSGFAPEKLEPLAVTFTAADGSQVSLRGGYYPAAYDPRAGNAGAKQAQAEEDALLGGNFTQATTAKGYTKERTQYAAPMLLDYHTVLSRHLNQVITDLAYRGPLRQMLRILGDPTIKGIIHQRMSGGAYHALLGSVRSTIKGTSGVSEPASGFFEHVKSGVIRNTVVAALGLKVGLLVANTVTAPLLATARVKTRFVMEGLGKYYRHPVKMTALVHALSPFMLDRATHTGQGYEDILAELRGKHGIRHRIAEASLAMHHWINPLVERGIWLGRYLQAQHEGAGIEESVRLADKAIRQTQTQAAPKDLSAVERDPRYTVFNLFLGPMVIANNRLQDAGLRGKLHGAVETPAVALGTWFAMVVANGALFDLLSGRPPDDGDDDGLDWQDWSVWLARKAALFPFQTMPFIRNAANLFDSRFNTGSARPDPLTEAMGLMYRFGKSVKDHALDAWNGDHDAQVKLTKDTVRAAGVAAGLPSTQAVTTGGNLYDVATGAEPVDSPLDARFLFYKRQK